MTPGFWTNALAFGVAAVGTAITLPLWRAWFLRLGVLDDPGSRKIHKHPQPLAGGFAIVSGLALASALGAWQGVAPIPLTNLPALGLGVLMMLLLGWADDLRDLRASTKFFGQLAVVTGVSASGVGVVWLGDPILDLVLNVFWILTITNAFNINDNMNGLCAGLGVISAAVLGGLTSGPLAWLVCGAVVGFLPWNFPRASAFLGDSGSHVLGFLIACLPLLPGPAGESAPEWKVLTRGALLAAVPLIDLVQVVITRWQIGQPFHVGDKNHLSHRLERHGFTRAQAVMILWAAHAAFAAISLAL
jgi:UDP-GlcNAc:undecaprenyl-phosphate GlcNAc-1-phosphate transferase